MGNNQSQTTQEKGKNLSQIVNFIATNYILTQSFEDLESLKEPEYCDKLVVVTSEVLNKYLSKMDVKYLAQKMKQGVEVNEMTADNVLYLRKKDLDDIDVKNSVAKKRLCIGIAKYYVKVAHIFSAIMSTINPTYSYKDEFGTKHVVPFSDKNKIPKGTADVKVNKINLCNERVNALVNGQNLDLNEQDSSQPIKIKPKFCEMNVDKKATEEQAKLVNKTLIDEIGIKQLERLYNDVYDYQSGKFTGMSDKMRLEYNKDLAILYKAFTGKEEMPSTVKTFADIPLRDFRSMKGCQGAPDNQFMREYEGTGKEKLFVDYANHVKSTMKRAEENKDALIGVLDKLFVFAVNPQTKKPEITINPKINDSMLDGLVKETQELIIKLYTTCEVDFIKGLEIFENIIQEQIKQNMERKIADIKKEATLGDVTTGNVTTGNVTTGNVTTSSQ